MTGNGNGNGNGIGTVSDELIAKARAIATRSDELLGLLEDARQKLLESRKPAPQQRVPARQAGPQGPRGPEGISEGLRLLTTQMSVEGSSRQEIAARLREEYGVKDPEPILKSMGL